jgi:PRA1 family protein 1
VPSWARPPGARLGRKNKAWGRQRSWEYDERFEELEDTEDGFSGVELDRGYAPKRFISDDLHFTGIDLGSSRARPRRSDPNFEDDSDYFEDEGNDDESEARAPPRMQLMLKEKEDILVERALERIARARALGKTSVKLSQAEIDALERLERNQQPAAARAPLPAPKPAPKSKKAAPARTRVVEHKKSSKSDQLAGDSPKVKATEPRRRGQSSNGAREEVLPYPLLPEDPYGAGSGVLMHAPQGYYGPPVAANRLAGGPSQLGSLVSSFQSLRQVQQYTQPLAYHQHPYFQGRYYANPDTMHMGRPSSSSSRASRPDPSEADWEPRARSSSSLVNLPIDQLPNPAKTSRAPRFDPNDPRFASPSPRRVVSGPPATYPQQIYHRPQDELFLPNINDSPALYGTDPQQITTSEDDDGGDDGDGEDGEGVQVKVVERPVNDYRIQTRSRTNTRGGQANGRKRGR